MNIFEMTAEMEQISSLLDSSEAEDSQLLEVRLAELEMARDAKLEAMGSLLKESKAMSAAIAEEIKSLQARKKTEENRQHALVNLIINGMDANGMRKFSSPRVQISRTSTKRLEVLDEEKLMAEAPEYFEVQQTVRLDKMRMKSDMAEEGVVFDNAVIARTESVRIK